MGRKKKAGGEEGKVKTLGTFERRHEEDNRHNFFLSKGREPSGNVLIYKELAE
jgi:hypothetical protein